MMLSVPTIISSVAARKARPVPRMHPSFWVDVLPLEMRHARLASPLLDDRADDVPPLSGRTGQAEQLDHREDEQAPPDRDEAHARLAHPEVAADPDQEQDGREEHGVPD